MCCCEIFLYLGEDILRKIADFVQFCGSKRKDVEKKDVAAVSNTDRRVTLAPKFKANRVTSPGAGLILNPGNNYAIYTPIKAEFASPPILPDPKYGVNVIVNSNLHEGLQGWYPMGSCRLQVSVGAPLLLGASAQRSFVNSKPPTLSGKYIHTSNRTQSYEGPAQNITDQIQLFNTYQVSVWVATTLPVGSPGCVAPQVVNVALDVDGQWMQGGEVMADGNWTHLSGSFRLEAQFKEVICYIQGPDPGVDVKVAGLQIFAVNRLARVPLLQAQVDTFRKRDVVVRVRDSNGCPLAAGTRVYIRQEKNSFPIGSAINYESLTRNETYQRFFLDHFNWAVFENELKWDQIEEQPLELQYKKADEMVKFCNNNEISMRGHCILWEDEDNVQDWVTNLEEDELLEAVQNRFAGLLSRYSGQFKHYDVNNEMLHGSLYKDKLGIQSWPYFFKLAQHFDPEASLFVNDYHIVDGFDCNSSPQKYAELIQFLRINGAVVGGIGVQAHVEVPIGPIISQALNELGDLGIPIWLTEIDVSSVNEFVRADDLEVVLREAYANPSVEGCLLWGFMEGAMSRENGQLLDADGSVTEAGRRLLALKQEWMTNCEGVVNDNGEIEFRGFYGDYTLSTKGMTANKTFSVSKGDGSAVVDITI